MALGAYRARSLYVVAVLGLAVLSLRPIGPLDRALDYALAPTRLLSELAMPFASLRTGAVRAASKEVRESTADEVAASRSLLDVERRFARPQWPELLEGRGAVHAEVVSRSEGNLDRILIRVGSTAGLQRGLPVVSGEHFVGRLSAIDREGGYCTVDLVTADDFFISARDMPETRPEAAARREPPTRFVVGGLAPKHRAFDVLESVASQLALAVHNPSRRDVRPALVEVFEPAEGADPFARLANGYLLGELLIFEFEPSDLLVVEPVLDYKEGLYQVLVLLPLTEMPSQPARIPDAFDDERWIHARVFLNGDPTFWRTGRKLSIGRVDGIRRGAALTVGARFAGRVRAAGLFSSDASLLSDPGLSFPALARIEGSEEPLVLGHLVALGPGSDGLRFRWEAVVPVPLDVRGDGPVPAWIYTGSGEAGVPRGLVVGRTELPRGDGVFELTVVPAGGVLEPADVLVRLPEDRGGRL